MKFKHWLAIVAGFLPLSLFAVVLFLTVYAWPAIKFNGVGFMASDVWNLGNLYANPVVHGGTLVQPGAQYGILFLVVGTLLTTALALAVQAGVGAAIFLAEAMAGGLRLALSVMVELLAAIPSVVFGLWGYVFIIPSFPDMSFRFLPGRWGSFPFSPSPPAAATGFSPRASSSL
jgi:phosphate transport system permease protein